MKQYLGIYVRGLMMGAADVVPGVSGGTIALVVGIYSRLVGAISAFDLRLLGLLRERKIREAAAHIDLWFLVSLLAGVGTAIVSLAKLITWLILNVPVPSWGFIFGLILASTWIVARMVDRWGARELALGVLGALFGYWMVGLIPVETPQTLPVVFFSGAIAICAMILPGISGSFVLVILGQYVPILNALHDRNLPVIVVFCAGCGIGLLSFAKFLKWLLAKAYTPTLVVLCGVMAGSLRKVWPWKVEAPGQELLKEKHRIQVNVLPEGFDGEVVGAIVAMLVGLGLVLLIDWAGRIVEAKNAAAGEESRNRLDSIEAPAQRAAASRN